MLFVMHSYNNRNKKQGHILTTHSFIYKAMKPSLTISIWLAMTSSSDHQTKTRVASRFLLADG